MTQAFDYDEAIDFTKSKRKRNPLGKLYQNLYGRNKFIKDNSSDEKMVNHFVQPELYYSGLPGKDIVTIHDLFLYRDDQYEGLYGKGRKYFFMKRMRKAAENADLFITVSEQTKRRFSEKMGVSKHKIKVINLGVREKFKPNKLDTGKMLGYLGDLRGRKRVHKLVDDWTSSVEYWEPKKDVVYNNDSFMELEIAGIAGERMKRIYRGDINYIGFIDEKDLAEWYNSLKAFILPSELEGFGLPILEATACGTPVYVYEDAMISEELERYVKRINSVSEIKEDDDWISDEEAQLERSKEVRKKFKWEKTIRQTEMTYDK